MAVASLRYDHPAYTVPVVFSGSTTAGPNGVTTKFCAFTAMKLKQVVNAPNLALPTTAAGSQPLLYTQNGTTTTTTTLTVLTSASYATVTDDISDVTLAAGNAFWFTHGTDATTSRSVAIEAYVIPGSNLQV
ncbi:hypothetical protein K0U83_06515 [bacterium]|jgi:hypothetical protein|nr:hypothetical protein [bacterium]